MLRFLLISLVIVSGCAQERADADTYLCQVEEYRHISPDGTTTLRNSTDLAFYFDSQSGLFTWTLRENDPVQYEVLSYDTEDPLTMLRAYRSGKPQSEYAALPVDQADTFLFINTDGSFIKANPLYTYAGLCKMGSNT